MRASGSEGAVEFRSQPVREDARGQLALIDPGARPGGERRIAVDLLGLLGDELRPTRVSAPPAPPVYGPCTPELMLAKIDRWSSASA